MSGTAASRRPRLSVLVPPYRALSPFEGWSRPASGAPASTGWAVVWELARGDWSKAFRVVRDRPGGVALLMVLPPADELGSATAILEAAEQCRPHSVLPYHSRPAADELSVALRRAPEDLPMEVMDYLAWRGLQVDQDTRRLIRRTVELSAELRTVSGLARSLYMSRRALGRRFRKWGLPVPSHFLHFARILRASIALQTTDRTLFEVACDLGYPDGFSLSNQMLRLTGWRPSTVREHLGWEWIVEAWLRTEASEGRLEGLPRSGKRRRSRDDVLRSRSTDPGSPPPTWRRSTTGRTGAAG